VLISSALEAAVAWRPAVWSPAAPDWPRFSRHRQIRLPDLAESACCRVSHDSLPLMLSLANRSSPADVMRLSARGSVTAIDAIVLPSKNIV